MEDTMTRVLARERVSLALPELLSRWQAGDAPVVTVYADWRVDGHGLRDAVTTLRKELHAAAEDTTLHRGAAHDSVVADVERVRAYLADGADEAARGLAVFACAGRGLWTTYAFRVPVATRLHVGDHPALLPLAELLQDDVACLVAVADTTRIRLIAIRPSSAAETAELQEDTWWSARLGSKTGWRQGHEQHARETMLQRFARDAAATVAEAMRRTGIRDLVVAGDDEIVPALVDALDRAERDALRFTTSIDMRARLDEVVEHVWPRLIAEERADRTAEVDELLTRAQGEAAYTTSHDEIRRLLPDGMADTVAFDPDALSDEVAEWTLSEALGHGTRVVIARGHAALAAAGGIVAKSR
jgi:Bacterial archaeo-eukaryotic release factor family 10